MNAPRTVQFPDLFVALDVDPAQEDTIEKLATAAEKTGDSVSIKLNSLHEGLSLIGGQRLLKETFGNTPLFVDLKVGDIPSTDVDRMRQLSVSASYLTFLMETLSREGVEQIVQSRDKVKETAGKEIGLIGITVLTSREDKEFAAETGMNKDLAVATRALKAIHGGFDAIVCSPKEAALVKYLALREGKQITVITPGIKPAWGEANATQKRTDTPAKAVEAGSDSLVVGTAIVKAADPVEAMHKVRAEMAEGKSSRDNAIAELMGGEGLDRAAAEKKYYKSQLTPNQKMVALPLVEAFGQAGAFYSVPEEARNKSPWCRLTSKRLSPFYLNVGGSVEVNPVLMSRIGQGMAEKVRALGINPQCAVGVALGSVRLSGDAGRFLNIPSVYLEKNEEGKKAEETDFVFKRHHIPEGMTKVILTEDLITKGTTVKKSIEALRRAGVEVEAVVVAINRSGLKDVDGIPIIAVEDVTPYDLSEEEFRTQYPDATIEESPKANWQGLMAQQKQF